MSGLRALGREKNTLSRSQVEYRAFHGQHCLRSINTPPERDAFLSDCDLFYGELLHGDVYYLAAGCVFDIDIQGPLQYQIRQATIARAGATLCELLHNQLQMIYDVFAGLPYCVYASGSKGLHVYVKNPDGFIQSKDEKKFTADIVSSYHRARFSEDFISMIDCSFYAHNKGIRPWTCAHPSTGVIPFVLYQTPDWDDDISGNDESDDSFLCWLLSFLPRYGSGLATEVESLAVEVVVSPRTTATRRNASITPPSNYKEINATLDEGSTLEEWVSNNSGGHTLRSSSGSKKRKYLYFGKEGRLSTWCPIAQAEHPSNCASWVRFDENGLCMCSCFDYACRNTVFILRPKIKKPVTYPVGCPDEEKITILAEQPDNPYLPSKTIIELLEEKKKLVVTANMGSGKTKTMSDFIEKLPASARILVIGTRRQQTRGWMSFFKEHDFRIYDEIQGSLYNEDRLLICLNSLLRVLGTPGLTGICGVKPYDLLVLDEADSLARWLGGSLLQNAAAIFECLKLLIQLSTFTICMDGLPTSALTCMLESLGFLNSFHWVVFNSYRFREVVMCNQTSYFINCFADALRGDRNVFFVSNSKTVITRFKEFAKKCGVAEGLILAIHGSMSESDRTLAANPDDWARYRIVLANTSLGPGVSFNPTDNPLHFSVVMFVAKVSQGAEPTDIAQLVNRVRHLESKKIIGIVLRKRLNETQAQVRKEDLYTERLRTIGEYAQSVVGAIAPERSLKKRQRADELIEQAAQRFTQLGKRLPAAKRRQMEYTPTIVPIPAFCEQTGELVHKPTSCSFGLRFGNLDYERLASHILEQSLFWSADSERFLKRLVKIFHKSGAGIITIGPRILIQDDKDVVLSSHYGFLNKILKLNEQEDESIVMDNDWFLLKARPLLGEEAYKKARKALFESRIPGMDTCLFRFHKIVTRLEFTDESIVRAIDHDVSRMFEDSVVGAGRALSGPEFRPMSHPRGPSLNNQGTPAEFINIFALILEHMGKSFDSETRSIIPVDAFSTETFVKGSEEHRKGFWFATQQLAKLAIREFPTFGHNSKLSVKAFLDAGEIPPSYPQDQKLMFPILCQLLAWLGFPVTKKQYRAYEVQSSGRRKRVCYYTIAFDNNHVQMCKSLIGLDPNGKKVTFQEALAAYFIENDQ